MDRHRQIRTELRALNDLLNDWDPIGVVDDQRRDGVPLSEYESYVPGILGLLQRGARDDQIAQHLFELATQQMGLTTTKKAQLQSARKICAWFRRKS